MIEFRLVPFHEIGDYVARNADKNHAESEGDSGGSQLNIDWDYALQASYAGYCVAVAAFKDQKPVGYSIFFINGNLHHKTLIEAENAAVYVEGRHRKEVSAMLFEKTKEMLKAIGVRKINFMVGRESFGRLLQRHGFESEFKQWSFET